jgi:hypothetical protein
VVHFTAPDEKIKKLLGIEDFEVDDLEVTVRGTTRNSTAMASMQSTGLSPITTGRSPRCW